MVWWTLADASLDRARTSARASWRTGRRLASPCSGRRGPSRRTRRGTRWCAPSRTPSCSGMRAHLVRAERQRPLVVGEVEVGIVRVQPVAVRILAPIGSACCVLPLDLGAEAGARQAAAAVHPGQVRPGVLPGDVGDGEPYPVLVGAQVALQVVGTGASRAARRGFRRRATRPAGSRLASSVGRSGHTARALVMLRASRLTSTFSRRTESSSRTTATRQCACARCRLPARRRWRSCCGRSPCASGR